MKPTLDLFDDLVRAVKLPLIECAHEARPDDEMTPERVSQTLLDEEVEPHRC